MDLRCLDSKNQSDQGAPCAKTRVQSVGIALDLAGLTKTG